MDLLGHILVFLNLHFVNPLLLTHVERHPRGEEYESL
jgi:hypothetical protein